MRSLLIYSLVLLCSAACGPRSAAPVATTSNELTKSQFPPVELRGQERVEYMKFHFWDQFNFRDTLALQSIDRQQVIDSYTNFIANFVGADHSPLDSLMRRASVSKPMLIFFWELGEHVLHDPNSFLRNDELYATLLRSVLASQWLDQWERIKPEHDLHMAMQNRVGELANDFRYTLASGRRGSLYGVQSGYTLLFLSNPDCPMCRDIKAEIQASPRLNEMIERGELKVLMLYIDEDLAAWRANADQVPSAWINAYDKGCQLRERAIYDLRATPALYLLDGKKRVLVKDSTSIPQIEEAIDLNS